MADITAELAKKTGILLELGCGEKKAQERFVGIDKYPYKGVDIVHDLETYPWPLADESVLTCIASHLVEHINPANNGFIRFMDELWRVMKVDGQVAICTPYAGSHGYWMDPTHVNGCNETTWSYFDPDDEKTHGELYAGYRPRPWRVEFLVWNPALNLEVILRKRAL